MQTRYHVIVHTPGPSWAPGIPFNQQQGVSDHADYMRALFDRGILLMGGPFLDTHGGGQVVLADVSLEEAEEIASKDPGVASGLLQWQVRPWFVAMETRTG